MELYSPCLPNTSPSSPFIILHSVCCSSSGVSCSVGNYNRRWFILFSLPLSKNQPSWNQCCLFPLGKMWFQSKPGQAVSKLSQIGCNQPLGARGAEPASDAEITQSRPRSGGLFADLKCMCVLSSFVVRPIVPASAFGVGFIQRAPRYVRAALWQRRHRWKLLMLAAGCDAQAHAPCAPLTLHTAHPVPSTASLESWHHPRCSDKGWSSGWSIL